MISLATRTYRELHRARQMWRFRGQERPTFAEQPGPGQESVWDYPRPPQLAPDTRRVEVRHRGILIAQSVRTLRVLETASPPTFYIPADDVVADVLVMTPGGSACEWKGVARYWALRDRPTSGPVGWSYHDPRTGFEDIRDHFSFYPARVECFVDGEQVRPQPGGFYGGWITDEIVGPVKGESGTSHW